MGDAVLHGCWVLGDALLTAEDSRSGNGRPSAACVLRVRQQAAPGPQAAWEVTSEHQIRFRADEQPRGGASCTLVPRPNSSDGSRLATELVLCMLPGSWDFRLVEVALRPRATVTVVGLLQLDTGAVPQRCFRSLFTHAAWLQEGPLDHLGGDVALATACGARVALWGLRPRASRPLDSAASRTGGGEGREQDFTLIAEAELTAPDAFALPITSLVQMGSTLFALTRSAVHRVDWGGGLAAATLLARAPQGPQEPGAAVELGGLEALTAMAALPVGWGGTRAGSNGGGRDGGGRHHGGAALLLVGTSAGRVLAFDPPSRSWHVTELDSAARTPFAVHRHCGGTDGPGFASGGTPGASTAAPPPLRMPITALQVAVTPLGHEWFLVLASAPYGTIQAVPILAGAAVATSALLLPSHPLAPPLLGTATGPSPSAAHPQDALLRLPCAGAPLRALTVHAGGAAALSACRDLSSGGSLLASAGVTDQMVLVWRLEGVSSSNAAAINSAGDDAAAATDCGLPAVPTLALDLPSTLSPLVSAAGAASVGAAQAAASPRVTVTALALCRPSGGGGGGGALLACGDAWGTVRVFSLGPGAAEPLGGALLSQLLAVVSTAGLFRAGRGDHMGDLGGGGSSVAALSWGGGGALLGIALRHGGALVARHADAFTGGALVAAPWAPEAVARARAAGAAGAAQAEAEAVALLVDAPVGSGAPPSVLTSGVALTTAGPGGRARSGSGVACFLARHVVSKPSLAGNWAAPSVAEAPALLPRGGEGRAYGGGDDDDDDAASDEAAAAAAGEAARAAIATLAAVTAAVNAAPPARWQLLPFPAATLYRLDGPCVGAALHGAGAESAAARGGSPFLLAVSAAGTVTMHQLWSGELRGVFSATARPLPPLPPTPLPAGCNTGDVLPNSAAEQRLCVVPGLAVDGSGLYAACLLRDDEGCFAVGVFEVLTGRRAAAMRVPGRRRGGAAWARGLAWLGNEDGGGGALAVGVATDRGLEMLPAPPDVARNAADFAAGPLRRYPSLWHTHPLYLPPFPGASSSGFLGALTTQPAPGTPTQAAP